MYEDNHEYKYIPWSACGNQNEEDPKNELVRRHKNKPKESKHTLTNSLPSLFSVPRAWFLNTTSSSQRRFMLKSWELSRGLPRAISTSLCSSSSSARSRSCYALATIIKSRTRESEIPLSPFAPIAPFWSSQALALTRLLRRHRCGLSVYSSRHET